MSIEVAGLLVTLFLGGVGLFFANNYSRQTRARLADARQQAYAESWEITGLAASTRLDKGGSGPLTEMERKTLYRELTTWYYKGGNGMLLPRTTRELYLNAKRNLLSEPEDLNPPNISVLCMHEPEEHLRLLPSGCSCIGTRQQRLNNWFAHAKRTRELCSNDSSGNPRSPCGLLDLLPNEMTDHDRRGYLSICQLSLLRTQMKTDLAIYGLPWVESLQLHERAFLRCSDVRLNRNPLATVLTWMHVLDPNPWVDAAKVPLKKPGPN